MTAPVTVSERDLRTLLGIFTDTRDDLPEAGLPLSLLAELTAQVRCDNVSVFGANYYVATAAESFMQELPPVDKRDSTSRPPTAATGTSSPAIPTAVATCAA
jgi:hypothetical protein